MKLINRQVHIVFDVPAEGEYDINQISLSSIPDKEQFNQAIHYIENNKVKIKWVGVCISIPRSSLVRRKGLYAKSFCTSI